MRAPGDPPFWLIAQAALSLALIHRRPSVTEQSVEGPGTSRRPTQEDEALSPAVRRRISTPRPFCAGAFVVPRPFEVVTFTGHLGGMHGQG
jgi:hypothetical protein